MDILLDGNESSGLGEGVTRATLERIKAGEKVRPATKTAFAKIVGLKEEFLNLLVDLGTKNPPLPSNKKSYYTSGGVYDVPADFEAESKRDTWMVYEAAFLWHGLKPPTIDEHEALMSPQVAQTKLELHAAIDRGELQKAGEYSAPILQTTLGTPMQTMYYMGYTRFVHRKNLLEYARLRHKTIPRFLMKYEKHAD